MLISLYGIFIWATEGRPCRDFLQKYICFDIFSTNLFTNLLRGWMNKLQKYMSCYLLDNSFCKIVERLNERIAKIYLLWYPLYKSFCKIVERLIKNSVKLMLPYGRILRTLQYIYLVGKWVGYWVFDKSVVNISIWYLYMVSLYGRPKVALVGISCKNIFALISSQQFFLQNSWEVEMNCKNIWVAIFSTILFAK